MQDFRKLTVWQRAHQFVLSVYEATSAFPEDERYGLTSQARRAAVSIPSNIAEGCGRETNSELRRFLYIAMGSAREIDYQLLLAHDLQFLDTPIYKTLSQELEQVQRMLNALIQRLTPDS
jgi:four helix bundle protein